MKKNKKSLTINKQENPMLFKVMINYCCAAYILCATAMGADPLRINETNGKAETVSSSALAQVCSYFEFPWLQKPDVNILSISKPEQEESPARKKADAAAELKNGLNLLLVLKQADAAQEPLSHAARLGERRAMTPLANIAVSQGRHEVALYWLTLKAMAQFLEEGGQNRPPELEEINNFINKCPDVHVKNSAKYLLRVFPIASDFEDFAQKTLPQRAKVIMHRVINLDPRGVMTVPLDNLPNYHPPFLYHLQKGLAVLTENEDAVMKVIRSICESFMGAHKTIHQCNLDNYRLLMKLNGKEAYKTLAQLLVEGFNGDETGRELSPQDCVNRKLKCLYHLTKTAVKDDPLLASVYNTLMGVFHGIDYEKSPMQVFEADGKPIKDKARFYEYCAILCRKGIRAAIAAPNDEANKMLCFFHYMLAALLNRGKIHTDLKNAHIPPCDMPAQTAFLLRLAHMYGAKQPQKSFEFLMTYALYREILEEEGVDTDIEHKKIAPEANKKTIAEYCRILLKHADSLRDSAQERLEIAKAQSRLAYLISYEDISQDENGLPVGDAQRAQTAARLFKAAVSNGSMSAYAGYTEVMDVIDEDLEGKPFKDYEDYLSKSHEYLNKAINAGISSAYTLLARVLYKQFLLKNSDSTRHEKTEMLVAPLMNCYRKAYHGDLTLRDKRAVLVSFAKLIYHNLVDSDISGKPFKSEVERYRTVAEYAKGGLDLVGGLLHCSEMAAVSIMKSSGDSVESLMEAVAYFEIAIQQGNINNFDMYEEAIRKIYQGVKQSKPSYISAYKKLGLMEAADGNSLVRNLGNLTIPISLGDLQASAEEDQDAVDPYLEDHDVISETSAAEPQAANREFEKRKDKSAKFKAWQEQRAKEDTLAKTQTRFFEGDINVAWDNDSLAIYHALPEKAKRKIRILLDYIKHKEIGRARGKFLKYKDKGTQSMRITKRDRLFYNLEPLQNQGDLSSVGSNSTRQIRILSCKGHDLN